VRHCAALAADLLLLLEVGPSSTYALAGGKHGKKGADLLNFRDAPRACRNAWQRVLTGRRRRFCPVEIAGGNLRACWLAPVCLSKRMAARSCPSPAAVQKLIDALTPASDFPRGLRALQERCNSNDDDVRSHPSPSCRKPAAVNTASACESPPVRSTNAWLLAIVLLPGSMTGKSGAQWPVR